MAHAWFSQMLDLSELRLMMRGIQLMFKDAETEHGDDFKQLREKNTLELRKKNREEILTKRRNILPVEDTTQVLDFETKKEKLLVVDQRYATEILSFLKWTYTVDDFNVLLLSLGEKDILKQHYGMIGIRKILSIADNPPIQAVIDAGLVPRMIEYIQQSEYPQLQLEATWALTNVASGTTIQCQSIIDKGGIPLFVQLLQSPKTGIVEQAIWAIGNISSDCVYYRDTIIRSGGMVALVQVIEKTQEETTVKHGCWAISNLCRGNPLPKYEIVRPAIAIMCRMIVERKLTDKDIIADCCWAISYHSDAQKQRIDVVVESGLVPYVVSYLHESYVSLTVPCVRIAGNVSTGTTAYTDMLMKYDILTALEKHLQSNKKIVRRECCWVLSNIAAGNRDQVEAILSRPSLLTKILSLFESDANEIKREICFIFSNLSHSGEPIKIFNLYEDNFIIRYYVNLFSAEDSKTIEISLECLYAVLALGEKIRGTARNPLVLRLHNYGAIDLLEKLQHHASEKVYARVEKILVTYFEIEDPLNL